MSTTVSRRRLRSKRGLRRPGAVLGRGQIFGEMALLRFDEHTLSARALKTINKNGAYQVLNEAGLLKGLQPLQEKKQEA